jgi:hypothetical protein
MTADKARFEAATTGAAFSSRLPNAFDRRG